MIIKYSNDSIHSKDRICELISSLSKDELETIENVLIQVANHGETVEILNVATRNKIDILLSHNDKNH